MDTFILPLVEFSGDSLVKEPKIMFPDGGDDHGFVQNSISGTIKKMTAGQVARFPSLELGYFHNSLLHSYILVKFS